MYNWSKTFDTRKEAEHQISEWKAMDREAGDELEYEIVEVEAYTGKHRPGEIVSHRGHECRVLDVWCEDGKNGVTIIPTGNYGFEIAVNEDRL